MRRLRPTLVGIFLGTATACGAPRSVPPSPTPSPTPSPPAAIAVSGSASSPPPPPGSLFELPRAVAAPEDGPLPKEVAVIAANDTEALVGVSQGGDRTFVVVGFATGCITEGWAFPSPFPPTDPGVGAGREDQELETALGKRETVLQVPTPLRPIYRAWIASQFALMLRFAEAKEAPHEGHPASFSADQRTVVLHIRDRAFLSRDGGSTFQPVLREADPVADRRDHADVLDDRYLLIADETRGTMLVRDLRGGGADAPLTWQASGDRMELLVGRVGTTLHLLPASAFPQGDDARAAAACTRETDFAAPNAPSKKGVCFPLSGGSLGLKAVSVAYPRSAFFEQNRASKVTTAVTLVDFAKRTHKRHSLEGKGAYGTVHVDPTGQVAWTGEDGRNRLIDAGGTMRLLSEKGSVARWAPPTSKWGVLLVDQHPQGGTLRDHRCSLLRAVPR